LEIGYSLVLHHNINAISVDKVSCEKFQLVCPACHEPLFKVHRIVNLKAVDYLAHFKRKNKEDTAWCELRVEQIVQDDKKQQTSDTKQSIIIKQSVNKVFLIGRLGKDPTTKANITAISIATTTNNNTEWHRVIFFDDLSSRASNELMKGNLVYIEGKLKTRTWHEEEKEITEIIAESFIVFD